MDVINRYFSALLVLILLTAVDDACAQNKQAPFYFDKPITLDSLTKYVHSHSKLRFSFNSTKIKGGQLIDLKKGAYTIDQLLQQIRKNTSLYYAMRNGYVIFQDNPPKKKTIPSTVIKPAATKPPAPKAAITGTQKPAPRLQPATVIKAPQIDSVKIKADSTHIPDSIKVFLPIHWQVEPNVETDDNATANSRKRFHLNLSFGRKPIDTTIRDTTIIDTSHLNSIIRKTIAINTTIAFKSDTTPVEKKKKERIKRTSAPARYYDDVGTAWSWQYGLQWKSAIPLTGSKYYFTGTNTRSEPYNLLIPGIWLSTTVNSKHELMLLVKPAEWYYYNDKVFRKDTSQLVDHSDSIIKIINSRKTTRLIKTGGWYGSLQYNYHLNENWLIGAGIGYHLRMRGLAYQQAYKNLSDTLVTDSLYSMEKGDSTNKYLASSFITGKLEIAYRFRAWDVGATLLMPLTNPFTDKSLNKSRPLNVQLFVRWRIKGNEEE